MMLTRVFGPSSQYTMSSTCIPAALMPLSEPFLLFYACYIYWEVRANVKKHQTGKSLGYASQTEPDIGHMVIKSGKFTLVN